MYIPEEEIKKIKKRLKSNGIIAFPKDTVWGIGCLVENIMAVEKIYSIKSREANKPLILLGKSIDALMPYLEAMPEKANELIKRFFPGALTLVIKKSLITPDSITSGFNTVGIRIPDHPVFIELLEKTTEKGVLATTSANISGEGSVSSKKEVEKSIGQKLDYILDDYGFPAGGKESTVAYIDKNNKIKVLRQGAIDLGEYINEQAKSYYRFRPRRF